MWVIRHVLESRTDREFYDLQRSSRKRDRIRNCQIIEYTRIDPNSGEVRDYIGWMRSLCPWELRDKDLAWKEVRRNRFNEEELLAEVGHFPRYIDEES